MSSIPDVVGFGPKDEESLPRTFHSSDDESILYSIGKTFLSNINEKMLAERILQDLSY